MEPVILIQKRFKIFKIFLRRELENFNHVIFFGSKGFKGIVFLQKIFMKRLLDRNYETD